MTTTQKTNLLALAWLALAAATLASLVTIMVSVAETGDRDKVVALAIASTLFAWVGGVVTHAIWVEVKPRWKRSGT